MRHLQPDLKNVHVRQAACIAPAVDFCERGRACVWNPCAVCSGKIENRQIAMLMAHCRSKRKLHVNCERDCERECFDRHKFNKIDAGTRQRVFGVRRHVAAI